MRFFASHRFFSLWFGLGLTPLALGSVVVACTVHLFLGFFTMVVLAGFMWIRARSTCCRCQGYGSLYCGMPSIVAPLLARQQSAVSFPERTVRFHMYLDLATMVYFNVIYALSPFWPLSVIWSIVACLIVFIPRRHHGLLHKLRRDYSRQTRVALPLVALSLQEVDPMGIEAVRHPGKVRGLIPE